MTVSLACLVREEAIEPLQNVQLSPSSIRVWIPIASNYLAMWGIFEHAQVIPSTTGGEWVVLNDYNFPKFSSWESRQMAKRIVSPTYIDENLFLYISRVSQGKGQFEWVSAIKKVPEIYEGKQFRFFISRPLTTKGVAKPDRSVMTNFIHSVDAAKKGSPPGMFQFIERKAPFAEIEGNLTSARGLVHLATFDRNPRVIYEALSYDLPVFVSVQSMPYQGFECAPPSFIYIVDATRNAKDLAEEFQIYDRVTANKSLTASHLRKVVRALTPKITYACVCEALGVCDDPPDSQFYSDLSSVYSTPGIKQSGLRLPPVEGGCPLGRNLEGIQCDRSEIFSCLRWVAWMTHKERKQIHNLFSQNTTTKKLFGKHFAEIKKADCYDEHRRAIFLGSIRSTKPDHSPTSFLGSMLRGAWVGGA
uniref:Uncharacterized protein n=1 Tax=Paramoeba aestuarina TaxID=180227 RepID=A0A7S4P132_9EUKA